MKVKVISDTFVRGKHVKAGTVLDLNVEGPAADPADVATLGLLNHAGRLESTTLERPAEEGAEDKKKKADK